MNATRGISIDSVYSTIKLIGGYNVGSIETYPDLSVLGGT